MAVSRGIDSGRVDRGGGGGAGAGGVVLDAEKLLETRAVKDVRDVEARTRRDIEAKRTELRQLVGGSYRDLIESADSITSMREACAEAEARLTGMKAAFASLENSVSSSSCQKNEEEEAEDGARVELYMVGSRVKYVVDSHEQIWGSLDVGSHLDAAERLLRAGIVHGLLEQRKQKKGGGAMRGEGDLLAKFPLMVAQWPATEALSAQILTRSTSLLRSLKIDGNENAGGAAAGGLAAAALAGNLDSESALTVLLEARESLLVQTLSWEGEGCDIAEVAEVLCGVVRAVEGTVGLVALLFCGSSPLLLQSAKEGLSKDVLFGGIASMEPEAKAWREREDEILSNLETLDATDVTKGLEEWLTMAKNLIATKGLGLLKSVQEIGNLAEVEVLLHEYIKENDCVAFCTAWVEAETASGRAGVGTWDRLCGCVLGREIDLWNYLLDGPLLMRFQQLLNDRLSLVSIAEPVADRMTRVAKVVVEKPSSDGLNSNAVLGMAGVEVLCRRWEGARSAKDVEKKGHARPVDVEEICDVLDTQFQDIIGGVKLLIDASGDAMSQALAARIAAVTPLLRENTIATVEKIIGGLTEELRRIDSALEKENLGHVEKDVAVRQALLVGHLCRGICSDSKSLPLIFLHPHKWRKQEIEPDLNINDENAKLLQKKLVDVSNAAFKIWMDWTVSHLIAEFDAQLSKENSIFTALKPQLGWMEVTLPVSGEAEGMKFSLPGSASSALLRFLFDALCELQNASIGRGTDKDVLRAYAACLLAALQTSISTSIDSGSLKARASEKGILQLLFDVKFSSDVLSGALPQGEDAGFAVVQKRKTTLLLSELSSRLDPIDWATYEPHLNNHEMVYYHRSSVLLGEFIYLHRLHKNGGQATTATRSSVGSQDVGMESTPSAARFTYLPVSMPALRSSKDGLLSMRSSGGMSGIVSAGGLDSRISGITSSLLEGDGDNKGGLGGLDFKGFVDSMGKSATIEKLGETFGAGLFSSLTGKSSK